MSCCIDRSPWNTETTYKTTYHDVWEGCSAGSYDGCYGVSGHYVTLSSQSPVYTTHTAVFDFGTTPIIIEGTNNAIIGIEWSPSNSSLPTSGIRNFNELQNAINRIVPEIIAQAQSKLDEMKKNYQNGAIDLSASHSFKISINKIEVPTISAKPNTGNKAFTFNGETISYKYEILEITN